MELDAYDSEDDLDDSGLSLLEYLPSDVLLEIFKFLNWRDLCQVSATCTKFHQISHVASIWLNIKTLDLRFCKIPDAEKILGILEKTPNAECVYLEDVISDEPEPLDYGQDFSQSDSDSDMEEGVPAGRRARHNLRASDRFLLSVLKACPRLAALYLHMHTITDSSIDAICVKCTELRRVALHDNQHISQDAVRTLVSVNTQITDLSIESCPGLDFISLSHKDAGSNKHLNLKRICFSGQSLTQANLVPMLKSCVQLVRLELTNIDHLSTFNIVNTQTGLQTLDELVVNHCEDLTEVVLPNCPRLRRLVVQCSLVKTINVSCQLLNELHVQECVCLEKLELPHCDLGEVNCADLTLLQSLIIGSSSVHTLNLSKCASLSTEILLTCVPEPASVKNLNICGCKNISPADVNTRLLSQFTSLEGLTYGGHSWNTVELVSTSLQQLHFAQCMNTAYLGLDMPLLQQLTLVECRDFTEQDLFDYFCYGRKISRLQGLEKIVSPLLEAPFSGGHGIPALRDLRCHHLPGLRGDIMSSALVHFQHLTLLEIRHCTSLAHLQVVSWPCIQHVTVESCNHLTQLDVSNVSTLRTLTVRWCSMLHKCRLLCASLEHVDTTGSSFSHLHIDCERIRTLTVNGICTKEPPENTLIIRCANLEELTITKCDRLGDDVMSTILQACPKLHSLTVIGSLSLKALVLPSSISVCSLTGHRLLKEISLLPSTSLKHVTLNNLPKLVPAARLKLLASCEISLRVLEVRAIPGETELCIALSQLTQLTLDQGIHLATLQINCPKLRYLRIQGCPRLSSLSLHVDRLAQVQVYHSTPLRNLQQLTVHCAHVRHLDTVLTYYCPNIQELRLHGSNVCGDQVQRLAETLSQLHTLRLTCCQIRDLNPGWRGDGMETNTGESDRRFCIERPGRKALQVIFTS